MGFVEVLLLLSIVLMRSVGWTSAAASTSTTTITTFTPIPSNCPKRCGNIRIEYPFGIGTGCSRDAGFNLTCTDQNRLFFGHDGTIEVREIDMDGGVIVIKSPIVTMGVDVASNNTSLIDLRNWTYSFTLWTRYAPRYYSTMVSNSLYVTGCSAMVKLVDLITNNTLDTCSIICTDNGSSQWPSLDREYCTLNISGWDGWKLYTSFGIQLTRVNQTELHLMNATSTAIKAIILDIYNYTGDQDVVRKIKERNTDENATLAWYINDHPSCKEAMKHPNAYACRSHNSKCYDAFPDTQYLNYSVGYVCRCSFNYQGNPFLPDGCQDPTFTPIPAHDCAKTCGSLNISFPFGLKDGCYRDKSFVLTCNETTSPPTLLLDDFYVVNKILLDEGKLELKYRDDEDGGFIDENRPFSFLGEQMTYGWVIGNQFCKDARKNVTTFACIHEHSLCVDIQNTSNGQDVSGYRCNCSQGYEGNPYLPNGCTDIDECNFPEKYVCYGDCTNTNGSYHCTCPQGTNGDPKRRGACIADKKQHLLLGIIIGVSNGMGLLLLSTSFVILRRKWKKRNQKKMRERHFRQNHGLLLKQLISSGEDIAERTKIFSLEEVEKATNNFDRTRVLGRGGHGTVYKGILSDQRVVAIKKSKIIKKSEIDQFINEVAILSQINHRNVVKLFGCCLETEVPLLIYEFISNGALSDHLHVPNGNSTLSWADRLRIATETVGALAYLHSAASISIFHRDVKSSNILLDDHFIAKVSDFGASRFIPVDQTHIITAIQGTFGYLDPEYYQTSQLTEKSDVYSFGIILLELLTGKKPILSTEHEENLNLSMHFLQAMRENRFIELVEDRVVKEATKEELVEVIQLIERCLKLKGVERPTMKEVEYRLQCLRRIKTKKRGHSIAEDDEESEYLLSDSSFTSSELVNQAKEGTSRNFSLEKEFMWSQQHPR